MTQDAGSSPYPDHLATLPPMQFIPIRKPELIARLAAQLPENIPSQDFQTLCTFLGAYFHHDFYDELSELKDIYADLSAPPGPKNNTTKADRDLAYQRLIKVFDSVMSRANFIELPQQDVTALGGEHPLLDVKTRTPLEAYDTIRIFRRGVHSEQLKRQKLIGKPLTITETAFDDVIIFIRFKDDVAPSARTRFARRAALPDGAVPGSVMVKSFRNITRSELPMLLPDVKIVMSSKDALFLGGPALIGGVPVALNIVPALSAVLFVLGAYLGIAGEVTQDMLMKGVGALSALVGAGAFMFRQYSNYAFRKLRYQKKVADNVYFKNVNNNSGVFESLISSAEDQEFKEVVLAFHALMTTGPVQSASELDRVVEQNLKRDFDIDVDFEVADALTKLERLGFLNHNIQGIAARPLTEALSRLDTLWDALYDFTSASRSKSHPTAQA